MKTSFFDWANDKGIEFVAVEEHDETPPVEGVALEAKNDTMDKKYQAALGKLETAANGLKSKLESLANQQIKATIEPSGSGYTITLHSTDPTFKGAAPHFKLKLKAGK